METGGQLRLNLRAAEFSEAEVRAAYGRAKRLQRMASIEQVLGCEALAHALMLEDEARRCGAARRAKKNRRRAWGI